MTEEICQAERVLAGNEFVCIGGSHPEGHHNFVHREEA